ncbi:DUF4352 domain-containing protein [Paenibacillus filicis]|uniref:DUF4352 domain-containing protein n=1 Tax=Paenibacillus filicis TaxID=669464 RepID=A0ABU9DR84_9BACL
MNSRFRFRLRHLFVMLLIACAIISAVGCSSTDQYESIYYGLKREVNHVEIRLASMGLMPDDKLSAEGKQLMMVAVNVKNYGSDPKVVESSMFTLVDNKGKRYTALPDSALPKAIAPYALHPGFTYPPYKNGMVMEHRYFAYAVPDTMVASRESTIPGHSIVYKDGKHGLRFSFDKRCISPNECFE